jgi:hypothetical protein
MYDRDPTEKHVGTPGLAALVEHTYVNLRRILIVGWSRLSTDEMLRSSTLVADVMNDPKTAKSEEPTDSPFNRYFNTKESIFQWLQAPENKLRCTRFNIAMDGLSKLDDNQSILRGDWTLLSIYASDDLLVAGFPWDSIPATAKIVDVGGGIGSVSMTIAKKYPDFRFVIQDFPNVIDGPAKDVRRPMISRSRV